jgi:3'(2'), 5'-bisphosphate nucleotidase
MYTTIHHPHKPGEGSLTEADDHALAHDLAERAGRLLLDLRAQGGDPDLLRNAGDRQSHEFLMAELAKARPHDAVLSEEGLDDKARLTADRVWIVDPLDGTREFGEPGRPDWAVHVALWQRNNGPGNVGAADEPTPQCNAGAAGEPTPEGKAGEPVRNAGAAGELTAGAVALPAQGTVLSTLSTLDVAQRRGREGDSGGPSEGVSAEIFPPGPGAERRLRLVVSRTRASQLVKDVASLLNAELVPCGSAGAKAATVIQGENDVYLHSGGFYEWDTAAPVAVARAAGLHVSRIDASDVAYNQENPLLPDILVCRPAIASLLLNAIREATHAI